jgi:hypothetical protein
LLTCDEKELKEKLFFIDRTKDTKSRIAKQTYYIDEM